MLSKCFLIWKTQFFPQQFKPFFVTMGLHTMHTIRTHYPCTRMCCASLAFHASLIHAELLSFTTLTYLGSIKQILLFYRLALSSVSALDQLEVGFPIPFLLFKYSLRPVLDSILKCFGTVCGVLNVFYILFVHMLVCFGAPIFVLPTYFYRD